MMISGGEDAMQTATIKSAPKRVAIACQGGGAHAAFTWGVLQAILERQRAWDAEETPNGRTFDIVAISGTSAGALCALATWYGLTPNAADAACGTIDKAIERLNFLWLTFAAETPAEIAHNAAAYAAFAAREQGVPVPLVNPYGFVDDAVLLSLAAAGARPEYLAWPALLNACCPDFDRVLWEDSRVRLLAGAIEVLSGNFEVFDSDKTLENRGLKPPKDDVADGPKRWRMRRALVLDGIAASGTLPELLKAQRIANMTFPTGKAEEIVRRNGVYWDGLYSQNPPVRDFLDPPTAAEKPDEIWVIRINPQQRSHEPDDAASIRDRQNELAGNISLNQELDRILDGNVWLRRIGGDAMLRTHKQVTLRTIKMTSGTAANLRASDKFNRSRPRLIGLRDEGLAVAAQWLDGWRTGGDAFDTYPDDARYPGLT